MNSRSKIFVGVNEISTRSRCNRSTFESKRKQKPHVEAKIAEPPVQERRRKNKKGTHCRINIRGASRLWEGARANIIITSPEVVASQ